MRHPRHLIEHNVPRNRRDQPEGEEVPSSQPQIRRQLERLCKRLDIEFDDVVELHISHNLVLAVMYDRDKDNQLYRDEFNKVATKQVRLSVDTFSFVGDEGDI